MGVYFAARFPDFREMVRSRYVGVWGSMLGVATAFAASLLTIGPCAVSVILYGELTLKFTLATVALGCSISIVGAKLALRQITHLLTNIRI